MAEPAARGVDVPSRLGRYEVLGLLATGGMAEILLGKLLGPAGFERVVVIKRVLPHLARAEEFRTMFLDEARIVARIRHSNVVQVHELGSEDGELFLVMEYVDGESLFNLAKRLSKSGKVLPPHLAAHVVAEACAGLHAAHELTAPDGRPFRLVHRDVSPHNLMITFGGAVKVLDFGIAKATARATQTQSGMMKGKFAYMAPEQCLNEPVDRRADIFALGIVLHEVSTGRRLFSRSSEMAVIRAVCESEIPRPTAMVEGYPPALEAVVLRALSRDPRNRYPTAADMRRDLIAVARDLDPRGAPQDELAARMSEWFAERKQEKAEMLRRVQSGSAITSIPGASSARRARQEAATITATSTPTARSRLRGVATAATLLGAGVLGAWIALRTPEPPSTPTPPEDPAPAAEPAPVATAAPEPSPGPPLAAPAAETVTVQVTTDPAGATVVIDGFEAGLTPLGVELPRGETAVALELRRRGYRAVTTEVVPDRDSRVVLTLRRDRSRAAAPPTTMTPGPAAPMSEPTMREDFFRFE
jgi:serine/threonine-protein kinase